MYQTPSSSHMRGITKTGELQRFIKEFGVTKGDEAWNSDMNAKVSLISDQLIGSSKGKKLQGNAVHTRQLPQGRDDRGRDARGRDNGGRADGGMGEG